MAAAVDNHADAAGYRGPTYTRHVRSGLRSLCSDPDCVAFFSVAKIADIDVIAPGRKAAAGTVTQRDIIVPGRVQT